MQEQEIMDSNLYDMKRLIFIFVLFLTVHVHATTAGRFNSIKSSVRSNLISDSLPMVLTSNRADLVESRLRNQAVLKFGAHQIPDNLQDLDKYRTWLKRSIIQKTGLIISPNLSGTKISGNSLQDYQAEYARLRTISRQQGETIFN